MKSKEEYRVLLIIKNKTRESVRCSDIFGAKVDGVYLNDVIPPGEMIAFSSNENDRFFMKFESLKTRYVYPLGVTCPRSSSNSATGYGTSGLQAYEKHGTPVTYEFHLGKRDLADWDHGDTFEGIYVPYGEV